MSSAEKGEQQYFGGEVPKFGAKKKSMLQKLQVEGWPKFYSFCINKNQPASPPIALKLARESLPLLYKRKDSVPSVSGKIFPVYLHFLVRR